MTSSVDRIFPVLLSGGSGVRLWPLSRHAYPKQFLSFFGNGTLLQDAAERVSDPTCFAPLTVVSGEEHRFVIAEQLRLSGITDVEIITEPEGRNTAPAIAVALLRLMRAAPDALILIMPSDHLIKDKAAFLRSVMVGRAAADAGEIVLFGVKATEAASSYGYILPRAATDGVCWKIERFIEKPDEATAQDCVDAGTYYWNSGVVLARAATLLAAFQSLVPELLAQCGAALDGAVAGAGFIKLDTQAFSSCPSIAFETAILERTASASLVAAEFEWLDLGAWSSIWQASEGKDATGNVLRGNVQLEAARGCYVHSEGPLVTARGIDNLIIVATADAVLVLPMRQDHHVPDIVSNLREQGHAAAQENPRVHRPWGFYETVHHGKRFQVKRVTVQPGAKLSLQKHHHRAEHWVVVDGTAQVRRGSDEMLLRENESIFIPAGAVHRLENPGRVPLSIIEVQSGSYLKEDDIVCFEDMYESA